MVTVLMNSAGWSALATLGIAREATRKGDERCDCRCRYNNSNENCGYAMYRSACY